MARPQHSFFVDPKKGVQRAWHRIDAKDQVLGRMATRIATLLRGKHKRIYTDFVDCGDCVEVTNASSVRITGNKIEQKTYFSHSGYAGGAKVVPLKRVMERDSRKVIYLAVRRMLPKNRLASRQLTRLRIYRGDRRPHGDAGVS